MSLVIRDAGFFEGGTGATLQTFALELDTQAIEKGLVSFEHYINQAKKIATVSTDRKKLDDLLTRAKNVRKLILTVGVLLEASKEGVAIQEIAKFQFFGTKTIPPRRPEIAKQKIEQWLKVAATQIMKGADPKQMLDLLGVKIAGELKLKIKAGIPPELVSREGTPLIDTGQLLGSISHEVG